MKTKKTRPIGKLAEARLLLEVSDRAVQQAQIELEALHAQAAHFDHLVSENQLFGKYMPDRHPDAVTPEDINKKAQLWRDASHAGLQVSKAHDELRKAQSRLSEIINEMRPGKATVTVTNKNRVPFVAPEMGCDWDEVQNAIADQADELQFAKWRKSSSVDNPQCKCCRRMKARINANSKPSKAHK